MATTNKKTAVIKYLLLIALITFVFISSLFLVKADNERGELVINLKIPSEYRKVIAGQNLFAETDGSVENLKKVALTVRQVLQTQHI